MSVIVTLLTTDTINGILEETGVKPSGDLDRDLAMVKRLAGYRNQREFVAWIINATRGNVTGEDLTEALKEEFPTAKVGDRHGPYYASLSRTGKLPGCEFAVAKAGRSARSSQLNAAKARIAELEAMVAAAAEAKSLKAAKAALGEEQAPAK